MVKRTAIFACLFTVASSLASPVCFGGEGENALSADTPLIYRNHLVYQGAFRLPSGRFGASGFDYGGGSLAFRPAVTGDPRRVKGSLFVVGNPQHQMVAEITIPSVRKKDKLSELATSEVLQTFNDITAGNLKKIDRKRTGSILGVDVAIGGLLVFNDKLIGTSYNTFDTGGFGYYSHFVTSLAFDNRSFRGMFRVDAPILTGQDPSGFLAGWMSHVPKRWQPALGGPVLAGQGGIPIIRRSSLGPSAFVLNPDTFRDIDSPVLATALLYYPLEHPNLGGYTATNDSYNGAAQIGGMAFPDGTDSLLFFGRIGTGPYCYGAASADPRLAFTCEDPSAHYNPSTTSCDDSKTNVTAWCYDPVELDSKGPHAYPYVPHVWAYDVRDLVSVKKGLKKPWDVLPYAQWNLDLPFLPKAASVRIVGVAFDPRERRLYLAQAYGDDSNPVVHVFSVYDPGL